MYVPHSLRVTAGILLVCAAAGCDESNRINEPSSAESIGATSGQFKFTPLASSTACTPGGNATQPFMLPAGYVQNIVASQSQVPALDNWDMNTQNETGPQAGRFLYRTHELGSNGAVSVTDLETGTTQLLAQRADWQRFDGLAWTPWVTLLAAEEVDPGTDPNVPQALAGLVYEIDPVSGSSVARPAVGSRSHEGLRFDSQGNLYGISEESPPTGGYIYKFVPDQRGDLSSGQLYALKIVTPNAARTGEANWVPLDRTSVQVNSDVVATDSGATGYARPEDVEIATSTGNNRGGSEVLYVAITGEDRVVGIGLRESSGAGQHETAFVYDYVREGLNAPADFDFPDNVALDKNGNLFITEDPPSNPVGADIWVATPSAGRPHLPAQSTVRFASLTDCSSEPTGIYFDVRSWALFVDAQHRGGDGNDLAVKIQPAP
jgi:secreted PhoX family phosphatase